MSMGKETITTNGCKLLLDVFQFVVISRIYAVKDYIIELEFLCIFLNVKFRSLPSRTSICTLTRST
jgi:hypothetical protein